MDSSDPMNPRLARVRQLIAWRNSHLRQNLINQKETIMATQCFDDPAAILEKAFCVSALSKDLRGELQLGFKKEQKCTSPRCKTLRTVHEVKAEVRAAGCDSSTAKPLNGSLGVKINTAFDTDGN